MNFQTIRVPKQRLGRRPYGNIFLFCACLAWLASSTFAGAFVAPSVVVKPSCARRRSHCPSALPMIGGDDDNNKNNDDDDGDGEANKFDMAQRIESLKSVVLGALSGGIALTPIAYLHLVVFSEVPSTAQWEFVTDMSSLEAGLFAIVYRYAVRSKDNNPMLNQGVVGAFVVVRTLANIQVTGTCQSVPLRCK